MNHNQRISKVFTELSQHRDKAVTIAYELEKKVRKLRSALRVAHKCIKSFEDRTGIIYSVDQKVLAQIEKALKK